VESRSKCNRVTREISEVTGRLGSCRLLTWPVYVRCNPFVCGTEAELCFQKSLLDRKLVQNK
jgi:hypothetical protein